MQCTGGGTQFKANVGALQACRKRKEAVCSDMQINMYHTRSVSSVPEALLQLTVYRTIPRNVSEALAWLGTRREYHEFLSLYLHLFPNEYAASEARIEIEEAWSYSPREVELFCLVDEHLFPLDSDAISDAGANGERIEVIYARPYEMPWWYEPHSLSVGWQVLLLLSGREHHDQSQQKLSGLQCLPPDLLSALVEVAEALTVSPAASVQRVRQICAQEASSSLADLGLALALLLQQTGNPWLDTDPDNEILYEGYLWSIEHVKEIAADYSAAQAIEQRVRVFVEWLEADLLTQTPLCLSIAQVACSPRGDTPVPHSA
jgi:hypothetical protein